MRRLFPMVLLASALALGAGCGPNPLLTVWSVSVLNLEGTAIDLPLETVETDEQGTRTTRVEMFISVTDSEAGVLSGTIDTDQSITTEAGTELESVSEPVSFRIEARRAYQMRGQALGGDLAMSCEIDVGLACIGTLDSGVDFLELELTAVDIGERR